MCDLSLQASRTGPSLFCGLERLQHGQHQQRAARAPCLGNSREVGIRLTLDSHLQQDQYTEARPPESEHCRLPAGAAVGAIL